MDVSTGTWYGCGICGGHIVNPNSNEEVYDTHDETRCVRVPLSTLNASLNAAADPMVAGIILCVDDSVSRRGATTCVCLVTRSHGDVL